MTRAQILFDGLQLRAVLHPGATGLLVVTFDYRQDGKSGFSPDAHSTGFARMGLAQLSIKTRANDWFINAETTALEPVLAGLAGNYDRVQMLGFSMGAFAAFRFAGPLQARAVLAVSPQVSPHPSIAPFEQRYLAEAAGFDPALGALTPNPDLRGLVLFDPFIAADLAHARALQRLFPAIRLVRLGFGGHPAFGVIRASGQSWTVQHAAVAMVADSALILAAHRAGRRGSADYWQRFQSRRQMRAAVPDGRPRIAVDGGPQIAVDGGPQIAVDGGWESP